MRKKSGFTIVALPSFKKDTKLPVILNHQELKELFAARTLLKQHIVLTWYVVQHGLLAGSCKPLRVYLLPACV